MLLQRRDNTETFAIPLYDITSSEKLNEFIIKPLLNKYHEPDDNP
jgi:hypothetical protein